MVTYPGDDRDIDKKQVVGFMSCFFYVRPQRVILQKRLCVSVILPSGSSKNSEFSSVLIPNKEYYMKTVIPAKAGIQ